MITLYFKIYIDTFPHTVELNLPPLWWKKKGRLDLDSVVDDNFEYYYSDTSDDESASSNLINILL